MSRLSLDNPRVRARVYQFARYAGVSVVANLTTISVLGILVGLFGVAAGWANVIAVTVATIPSFELNRRWVWGRSGERSLATEVVPFWVWAFLELAISSFAVHLMGQHATAAGWSRGTRTFAVEVTTIATTGALWLVQFVLFDRVLFRKRGADPAAVTVGAGGVHAEEGEGAVVR